MNEGSRLNDERKSWTEKDILGLRIRIGRRIKIEQRIRIGRREKIANRRTFTAVLRWVGLDIRGPKTPIAS